MNTVEVVQPADIEVSWGETFRVLARCDGRVVFECIVTPRSSGPWLLTEALPRRRAPEPVSSLLAVCDWLAGERGADRVVAIVPAFWDEDLSAAGAGLLQRIVPMRLPLDEDLLQMRVRPLPETVRFASLEVSPGMLDLSAGLPAGANPQTWGEICAGEYGSLIAGASLSVTEESALCAAIAVTEYRGGPLVADLVTAAARRERGLGRALLLQSMRRLCGAGYVDCHLNVVEDNWVARRLYRSVGFIQSGPVLRASYLAADRTR